MPRTYVAIFLRHSLIVSGGFHPNTSGAAHDRKKITNLRDVGAAPDSYRYRTNLGEQRNGDVMKVSSANVGRNLWLRHLSLAACLTTTLLHGTAFAAALVVPNADFSNPANEGSLGGGLLGATGSGPIGAGPWNGAYAGIAALLMPPVLAIGQGQATISGIAVDALQAGNSGAFSQTLTATYAQSKHYVLVADVEASTTLLGANILGSGNFGLALSKGASTLASTQNSPAVALSLMSDRKAHLALAYDTLPIDAGNIGVSLYASPNGIASVNVIQAIGFSNVRLTQAPIPALPPAQIGQAGGTPQAATINTAFSAPLIVAVVDAEGDPLEGVTVTFTAPASGASATLPVSLVTDVGGRISVVPTANGTAGSYVVTASVTGVAQPTAFNLTNAPAGQPAVVAATGGAQGQSAMAGSPFACKLAVKVIVDGAPTAGATVMFNAPVSGASSTLDDGTFSGAMLIETTDVDGVASVSATANANAGSYNVTAIATALTSGVLVTPVLLATYSLTNLDLSDAIFANGFDPVPALCAFSQ
jgi:hypothetical protein